MLLILESMCELFPAREHHSGNCVVRVPRLESAVEVQAMELPDPAVVEAFRERVVLVTGAGGSVWL